MDHLQELKNQLIESGVRLDMADRPRRRELVSVPRLDNQFKNLCAFLAASDLGEDGRFDAGESALLARQLLFMKNREVQQLYTKMKARQFIPVSNEVNSGADTFSVPVWSQVGMAKLISNYADDFPSTDVSVTEVIQGIRGIGNSYQYTVQDLRRSAMAGGKPLDVRRASNARLVHEKTIESVAALGTMPADANAVSGATALGGFAKNANVTVLTAGGGITGGWSSATAAVIVADLQAITQKVITQSKQVHTPDTLLLDTTSYALISQKPATTFTLEPILTAFLRYNPYIKNVDQWQMLDNANSTNNGPRVVAYERTPDNLELEIPQEFEQFSPQQIGLLFKIMCHSRIGGVSVYHPLSMVYADGV